MASMFFPFRIFLCLFILLPFGSLEFICPGPFAAPHGLSYAHMESNIGGRANEEYERIRIKLFYDLTMKGKPYKDLVQEAADFWANALSVKPLSGRLFKSRDCEAGNKTVDKERYCLGSCATVTKCNEFEIPTEHLDGCKSCNEKGQDCSKRNAEMGTGIENADLVFYVSAIHTNVCRQEEPVAYAGPCEFEHVLDRPVFAQMNFCPKEAAVYSHKNIEAVLLTIKHEMMHALGFSTDLFKLFRDNDGEPLWQRDKNGLPISKDIEIVNQSVMLAIPREWHVRGKPIVTERMFLVTPSVVREARNHFDCPDLEGAELENYGDKFTKYSHFEARIFQEDAMKTNMYLGQNVFSRLDFAVLEDSGWYEVNYSQAENVKYGRSLGCDFCKKSCKYWMDKRREEGESIEPYCDTPDMELRQGEFCNGTKRFFTGCPLANTPYVMLKVFHDPNSTDSPDELPRKYQNFDEISGVDSYQVPTFGSFDCYADFCPILLQNLYFPYTFDIDCPENDYRPPIFIPAREPKPAKEPKADEGKGKSNQSFDIVSSVLLICLMAWMVILL